MDPPAAATPHPLPDLGTPHVSYTQWPEPAIQNFFPPPEKKSCLSDKANPSTAYQIKLFDMNTTLPTQTALVNIHASKSHDFLYVIKQVNTETWLPRISKAIVKDLIKSPGLYNIRYRIYTNEKGYESIFISKAQKIMTA